MRRNQHAVLDRATPCIAHGLIGRRLDRLGGNIHDEVATFGCLELGNARNEHVGFRVGSNGRRPVIEPVARFNPARSRVCTRSVTQLTTPRNLVMLVSFRLLPQAGTARRILPVDIHRRTDVGRRGTRVLRLDIAFHVAVERFLDRWRHRSDPELIDQHARDRKPGQRACRTGQEDNSHQQGDDALALGHASPPSLLRYRCSTRYEHDRRHRSICLSRACSYR